MAGPGLGSEQCASSSRPGRGTVLHPQVLLRATPAAPWASLLPPRALSEVLLVPDLRGRAAAAGLKVISRDKISFGLLLGCLSFHHLTVIRTYRS